MCSVDKLGNLLPVDMVANLWPNKDFRADAIYWRFVRYFLCIWISASSITKKLNYVGHQNKCMQ